MKERRRQGRWCWRLIKILHFINSHMYILSILLLLHLFCFVTFYYIKMMHFKNTKNRSYANVYIAGASTVTGTWKDKIVIPFGIHLNRRYIVHWFRSQILFLYSLNVGSKIHTIIRQMQTAVNNPRPFSMDVWMTMAVWKTDKLWWEWNFHRREQMICVVVGDGEKGQISAGIAIKIFQYNILHFHWNALHLRLVSMVW